MAELTIASDYVRGLNMVEEERDSEFREMGNARINSSLAWAGFALTNFVTVVAIFSVFGEETGIPFQIASSFFLMSGAFFAISWALNETAGSNYRLRLPLTAHSYKLLKITGAKDGKVATNAREIYVKQAEVCNIAGTFVWSVGVTILLWDLRMYITAIAWVITFLIAYLFAIPRYFTWKEKQRST